MLNPLNKELAFAAIAEELELPLVLLSSPDPQARLAQLDKIGAALASTNLTWRDLAERVVGPRPVKDERLVPAPPPPMPPAEVPRSKTCVSATTVLSNEEQAQYGYRSGPDTQNSDAYPKRLDKDTETSGTA